MKNRVFVFVMLAATVAGLVSCNCGQKQPTQYAVTVETLTGTDVLPQLNVDKTVALWADEMVLRTAHVVKGEESLAIVRDDTAAMKGVVHVVYPLGAVPIEGVTTGRVVIDTLQQALPLGEGMVYYGETTQDAPDAVVLKAVGGVLRMNLTTPEKIAKVEISTSDSNRYMAGVFELSNYPFPVLAATEASVRSIAIDGLGEIDFTEGADVFYCLAPGCYKTFTVVMTTTDGRTCTKSLKEGKEVLVDRNHMHSIVLGDPDSILVFE